MERAQMDRANHDHLGDLRHLDGVCYDRTGILYTAISARFGRGRIFSRNHRLSVSLVSLQRSRKGHRYVYVRHPGLANDRRADIGGDYGARPLARLGRMAMGLYSRRHPGSHLRIRHDLLPYRSTAPDEMDA